MAGTGHKSGAVSDSNWVTYTSPRVTEYYAGYAPLQDPESAILSELRDSLPGMRMLDIGVGGGRTTRHLAPLVKEYFAIDYSCTMIERCRKEFAGIVPPERFLTADATALEPAFPGDRFDFILFSFNGIDYSDAAKRARILREIRAKLRAGGYFVFSSHNLQALSEWKRVRRLPRNPRGALKELCLRGRRLILNRAQIRAAADADSLWLNDGAHDFSLSTCYIRPQAQVTDLEHLGFRGIRLWDRQGDELRDADEVARCTDSWIYYLCSA
jgi:SAM-dependent methyltransferase